mgnify:CR=1 FL=1
MAVYDGIYIVAKGYGITVLILFLLVKFQTEDMLFSYTLGKQMLIE